MSTLQERLEIKKKYGELSKLTKTSISKPDTLTESQRNIFTKTIDDSNRFLFGGGNGIDLEVDYISTEVKKRAQTISLATNIATKLLIALRADDLNTFVESLQYTKDPTFLEVFNKEHGNFAANYFIYVNMMEAINLLPTLVESKNILKDVSDVAVSLAWLEAYYSSGYFPQEVKVMVRDSLEHDELVIEVNRLLKNVNNGLISYLEATRTTHNLPKATPNVEVVSEELNLRGNSGLLLGKTAVIIKTGGSKFNIEKVLTEEVQHANAINNLLNKELIDRVVVYYPRFKVGIITQPNEVL